MTLSSPLNTQQLELESTTTLESQLQQSLSQETIGLKCIKYLGEPKPQIGTFKKGYQGEVIAAYKLGRQGYDVRLEKPCHYDLTIHLENGVTRIQVKTFIDTFDKRYSKVKHAQMLDLKSRDNSKSPYLLTDFDFLAAVDVETEEVFLVPIRDIASSYHVGRTKCTVTRKSISSYKI